MGLRDFRESSGLIVMPNLIRMNSQARLLSMGVVVLATCCLIGSLSTPRIGQAAALEETLFEQPSLDGIAGNFFVPPAAHKPPPVGIFSLILWQPNPNRGDGMLVPTQWAAGAKTGFYPSAPVDRHQSGFRDIPGTTTVQADGDTVGAYINSADLPAGSHKYKMMITPQYLASPAGRVRPFGQSGRAILISLELQVHGVGCAQRWKRDLCERGPYVQGSKWSHQDQLWL